MDADSATPMHHVDTITLCNGIEALVRPLSPNDDAALLEFCRHLPDRSRLLRYLSPQSVLSLNDVQRATCVDGVDRVALVVEVNGAIVAVGRYDRLCDPRQAEVAFAVADGYQHQYIASELLCRLAHVARVAGISQFKAEVLLEDATMGSVFREAGFPLSSTRQWDTVEMTLNITSNLEMVSGI